MGRLKEVFQEKTEQVSTLEGSVKVIEEFLEKSRADLYPWEQIAIETVLEAVKHTPTLEDDLK